MIGFHFNKYDPNESGKTKFDQLLDLFMQLLTYTSGDVAEALDWMNQLDRQYEMTNDEYGMGDFIDDLKNQGYITENEEKTEIRITPKPAVGLLLSYRYALREKKRPVWVCRCSRLQIQQTSRLPVWKNKVYTPDAGRICEAYRLRG